MTHSDRGVTAGDAPPGRVRHCPPTWEGRCCQLCCDHAVRPVGRRGEGPGRHCPGPPHPGLRTAEASGPPSRGHPVPPGPSLPLRGSMHQPLSAVPAPGEGSLRALGPGSPALSPQTLPSDPKRAHRRMEPELEPDKPSPSPTAGAARVESRGCSEKWASELRRGLTEVRSLFGEDTGAAFISQREVTSGSWDSGGLGPWALVSPREAGEKRQRVKTGGRGGPRGHSC